MHKPCHILGIFRLENRVRLGHTLEGISDLRRFLEDVGEDRVRDIKVIPQVCRKTGCHNTVQYQNCSRCRFLREDNDQEPLTWEEQLAKKYYDNLYREYAVCDLKHYKTGNVSFSTARTYFMNELRSFQFSLRWRTEDEVLSGAGETTCGNTRCPFHDSHNVEEARPSLKTLELPFSYEENGENKFALVKVVSPGPRTWVVYLT